MAMLVVLWLCLVGVRLCLGFCMFRGVKGGAWDVVGVREEMLLAVVFRNCCSLNVMSARFKGR